MWRGMFVNVAWNVRECGVECGVHVHAIFSCSANTALIMAKLAEKVMPEQILHLIVAL